MTLELVNGWACLDCAMLIANGETPERMTETEAAEWLAEVDRRGAGGAWGSGRTHGVDVEGCGIDHGDDDDDRYECETVEFSWSWCSVCGSTLGGSRHGVHWWPSGDTVAEDDPSLSCDRCGGPVDSLDGWTDGTLVLCGSMRGNGCDRTIETDPEGVTA
jgi:hypothetical protein